MTTPNPEDAVASDREVLSVMGSRQEMMNGNIKEIRDYLLGTEFHPMGLVGQVDDHEKRLGAVERRLERVAWVAVGAGLGGALGGGGIVAIVLELLRTGG